MPWSPIVLFRGTHLHFQVPLWASLGDIQDIDECTLKIEGDLLCELVAVSNNYSRVQFVFLMLINTRFQYNDMTSMQRKMFAPFGLIHDYILRSLVFGNLNSSCANLRLF